MLQILIGLPPGTLLDYMGCSDITFIGIVFVVIPTHNTH